MSCSEETVNPGQQSCSGITYDYPASQRIHLMIDRTDPFITFVWQPSGYTVQVPYPDYLNNTWVLCFGHTLTLNNECTIAGK